MKNYFIQIIKLFANTHVSSSTEKTFYHWLTDNKFVSEKEEALYDFWNHLEEGNSNEVPSDVKISLKKVERAIDKNHHVGTIRHLRLWQTVAAVLLLALLSMLYFQKESSPINTSLIEQYTPVAETNRIILPDGSEVQLNSTSTLLYPEQFNGQTRSVYLIGEANFKVTKNKKLPFIVKSNDFQVTALGTEFNVRAYPDDPFLAATLLSGSIEVKFNNLHQSVILNPGEQLSYCVKTKESSLSHPDLLSVTAWQRGELIFKSSTLEEIITVLERKFPVTFVYAVNTLRNDKYTFRFSEDAPLQEIMDIIVEVSGHIQYRIENGTYYILPG